MWHYFIIWSWINIQYSSTFVSTCFFYLALTEAPNACSCVWRRRWIVLALLIILKPRPHRKWFTLCSLQLDTLTPCNPVLHSLSQESPVSFIPIDNVFKLHSKSGVCAEGGHWVAPGPPNMSGIRVKNSCSIFTFNLSIYDQVEGCI